MSALPTAQEHSAVIYLEPRRPEPGFNARDLQALTSWANAGRRAVIYHDDPDAFALLYCRDEPWASWAVSRQEGVLLVWNCVTFADLGRFDGMAQALRALPGGGVGTAPVPFNVVSLMAERARRQGT